MAASAVKTCCIGVAIVLFALSCAREKQPMSCPEFVNDIVFPLADGNTWTYVVTEPDTTYVWSTRVTGSVQYKRAPYWILETQGARDPETILLRQDGGVLYEVIPNDTLGGSPFADSLSRTFPWRLADLFHNSLEDHGLFTFNEVDTTCGGGAVATDWYSAVNYGQTNFKFHGCVLSVQQVEVTKSREIHCPATVEIETLGYLIADEIGIVEEDRSFYVWTEAGSWTLHRSARLDSWSVH